MQLFRPISDPLCQISSFSVAPPIVGKSPKFSIFSGEIVQKGEVSFDQWVIEVECTTQSFGGNILGWHCALIIREQWQTWYDIWACMPQCPKS